MAKINHPVDHMFRAGQISSKEWARLSMKQPGKGQKTHGRMANFDEKTTHDGGLAVRSVSSTKRGHLDGPDQGAGAKGAFSPPTRGGGVRGGGGNVTKSEINEGSRQRPEFPRQGSGRKPGKSFGHQQPSSSSPGGGQYGGPSRRPNAPSRLGRAETRGGSM